MKQSGKFTLRIDQDLINFLKNEAATEGLSLSAYIRRMLRAHLNKTKLLNQTTLRAVLTTDAQNPRGLGVEDQESSPELKREEPAHLAFKD